MYLPLYVKKSKVYTKQGQTTYPPLHPYVIKEWSLINCSHNISHTTKKNPTRQGPEFEKRPLDLLIRGLDNFTTMEPYFGGLKSLCDNSYYMTLNMC